MPDNESPSQYLSIPNIPSFAIQKLLPNATAIDENDKTAIPSCKGCGHPASAKSIWTFMRSSREVMTLKAQEGCRVCDVLLRGLERMAAEDDGLTGDEFSVDKTQIGLRTMVVRVLESGCAVSFYVREGSPLLSNFLTGWPVGYDISGDTNSDESFAWFMKQLQYCIDTHKICDAANANSILPKRVLDVGDSYTKRMRLHVSKGETERYACLTHCWGTDALVQTLSTNIKSYQTDIPWDSLPLTYQDAIEFTRRLKVRYLWIDSLCIIQDDEGDWRQEAAKMASTYQSSYLTISATKSAGSDGGLFSIAPAKLKKTYGISASSDQNEDICVRLPLTHLERRPGYGTVLNNKLPVFTRGWILQERLLSPRVLHFGPEELSWECLEESACECAGSVTDKSAMPYFSTQPKLYHNFASWQHLGDDELTTRWHDLVQEYTRLELSHEQDIFPAISGLAKDFALVKRSPYHAGLWGNSMLIDLLWKSSISYSKIWPRRPKLWRAPTWSWASIKGDISYMDVRTLSEPCKILSVCCSHAGIDLRGELSGGYIVLKGMMVVSKLRYRSSDSELTPHGVYELELLKTPKRVGNVCADYNPLTEERSDLDAVMMGYCFRIGREISRGSSHYLLLKRVGEDADTRFQVYERIGHIEIFTDFGIQGEEVDVMII